jgi:hypothetical protein
MYKMTGLESAGQTSRRYSQALDSMYEKSLNPITVFLKPILDVWGLMFTDDR